MEWNLPEVAMRPGGSAIGSKTHLRRRSATPVYGLLIAALAAVLVLALSTVPQAAGPTDVATGNAAATTEVVAIRAKANNKYVSADNAGKSSLIANRTSVGAWETFDLIHINTTDVYLRAHANGKYVCAEAAGTGALISNRDTPGPWETFELITNSDGTKSLRARANNKLVTAESAGGAPLIANRDAVGPWEKFVIVELGSGAVPAPGGWPSTANTGVPPGSALTAYTGPMHVTSDGAVIQNRRITGTLVIGAANVRISRSQVNGRIESDSNSHSVIIEDSEIIGDNSWTPAVGYRNITMRGVEVTGSRVSVLCGSNCDIQDSLLHKQYMQPGSDWHVNGYVSNGGSNVLIKHNTLACDVADNSNGGGCTGPAASFGDFEILSKITYDNNLFLAGPGGYCLHAGYNPSKPYGSNPTQVVVTNNVFQRGSGGKCGYWGPVTSFHTTGSGNVWSNNRFEDGQPINP